VSIVTVAPDTVHTAEVAEVNVTVREDVAVAVKVTVFSPKSFAPTVVNVIDCEAVGVTELDASDALPVPLAFVAVTLNV
jgi:hypothetical protein